MGAEGRRRLGTHLLLDVVDPATPQHAEPCSPARDLGQVGHHVRTPLVQGGERPDVTTQPLQGETYLVATVLGAFQQLP
jgi:hypothetical protein